MEIQELNELLAGNTSTLNNVGSLEFNAANYIQKIIKQWKRIYQEKDFFQYNPELHAVVRDKIKRKDKTIFVPTGKYKPDGKTPITEEQIVYVARLPVPYQRIIVARAAQFLTGGKVTLTSDADVDDSVDASMLQAVKDVWKYNKLQFRNNKIAKAMMSQLECVELWYSVEEPGQQPELRMNILTPAQGFEFYPVFDAINNMIAFGIAYETDDKVKHFDLYTDTEKRSHIKVKSTWVLGTDEEGEPAIVEHGYGKIPIIYYTQEEAEWSVVQRLIERYETLISNFADINDYNGSPILFLKGKAMSLPTKGQAGKTIQNEDGTGDVKYVTWEQAPESIKLEIETLGNLIFSMTQTAPIDFENMKGLGDLSGVAFDRVLIDSHLKAKEKQNDVYGECIQRRINFLIAALASMFIELAPAKDLNITPTFDLFRIDDESDKIALITQANGGKPVISQQTSVALAGMVQDASAEWNLIKQENDTLGNLAAGGI